MVEQPFGAHSLSGWRARALSMAQSTPKNWGGRRLALALRKLVLKSGHFDAIDAEVEGVKIRCHMNDNVSERKFLFTPQFFDVAERDLIATHLPKDGVFIDIGANAGLYTLWAAKNMGVKGHVYAIEPNPVVRSRLEHNLSYNAFAPHIEILPWGVSDAKGHFQLHLDKTNLGGSSLVEGRSHQEGEHIDIECFPLIDILDTYKIKKIDMLKIDIEGAEAKALMPFFNGADRGFWPKYLIIENDPAQWESGLIDFLTKDDDKYILRETTRMNFILELKT